MSRLSSPLASLAPPLPQLSGRSERPAAGGRTQRRAPPARAAALVAPVAQLVAWPPAGLAAGRLPVAELASLYDLVGQADEAVVQQLAGLSPLTFAVVLGAGLVTSLSPCTLSVLPLTIGYIGGYSGAEGGGGGLAGRALSFAAGLATTLAALGLLSSLAGGAYGQIGDALPVGVALVAMVMGLNLLGALPLALPSIDVDVRGLGLPPAAQAYLAGATFALAASPCSTPVLATLLAWVATTRDPVAGGALLLAYAAGYVAPLLAAALFAGSLPRLLALRQYSAWATPASGVALLAGGTYALLSRVVPY